MTITSDVIHTPIQRLMGFIETRAEAIKEIAAITFESIETSVIHKMENFPQSHPRIIKALEPTICSLLRFANNHSTLFTSLIAFAGVTILITSLILVEHLVLSKIIAEVLIITIAMTNTVFLIITILLGIRVPENLVKKHLEQAVINKLTTAFLGLPSEFVASLNEWTRNESQEVDSHWLAARKKILDFYNSNSSFNTDNTLDFSHFNLHSLPNVFDNPKFRNKLRKLYLNGNNLTRLPESIGSLQSLKWLNLNGNNLTRLPESIGSLQSLKRLNLKGNNLTRLPESIGSLQSLNLLNLNGNNLTRLPESIGSLQSLNLLNLSENNLTRLPESIGSLQLLSCLGLADNSELVVEGILPAILRLPPTCIVDIDNCNSSRTVLAALREATREDEYTGPRISYSMRDDLPETTTPVATTIEESLRRFYGISGRNYNGLPELNRVPNLLSWLNKLTMVADFRSSSQRTFVTKIIEYLERANADPSFREVFSETISDATTTCGDRVALSILNIGIAYKLSTIDLNNMHELYHLLMRGVLALDLLQDIARKKISTLREFDEIEVYLGYPVQLKKALHLPIDIENMLFFGCSAISTQDLEDAKNSVLDSLSNEDMQIAFLKNHPKWIDALNIHYPEEMEKIIEDTDTSEEGLINLIRKVIQSFNS